MKLLCTQDLSNCLTLTRMAAVPFSTPLVTGHISSRRYCPRNKTMASANAPMRRTLLCILISIIISIVLIIIMLSTIPSIVPSNDNIYCTDIIHNIDTQETNRCRGGDRRNAYVKSPKLGNERRRELANGMCLEIL